MHWTVAAPFFTKNNTSTARWLDDYVPKGKHTFLKIPRQDVISHSSWHNRATRNTPFADWASYWKQSGDAWQATEGGVITVFPQLAAMIGVRRRLSIRSTPVVAWCFNIGDCYPGLKQLLATNALKHVDRFVVHSRGECVALSTWTGFAQERFEFVPLQRAPIPGFDEEEKEVPFILALGSANRDYSTLCKAVEKINIRTVIVAGNHAVKGLNIPNNVEIVSGLTSEECHRLAQRARIIVVPLINGKTAAGQVTIVEAMRMGRPIIATRSVGSEDYILPGKTGLLVEPNSVKNLSESISGLWSDEVLRDSIAQQAYKHAEQHFSDEAVGVRLSEILDSF